MARTKHASMPPLNADVEPPLSPPPSSPSSHQKQKLAMISFLKTKPKPSSSSKPKPKKSKSTTTSSSSNLSRRSQRVISGAVKSNKPPKIDNTVHKIDSDAEKIEPRVDVSSGKRKAPKTPIPSSKKSKENDVSLDNPNSDDEPPEPPSKKPSKPSESSSKKKPTSSKKSKKPKPPSLDDVFSDPKDKAVFLSKWSKKTIANGRLVDLKDMASRGRNLKPHFDALGWTNFLSVKELQYERLTQAFFAALKFSSNNNVSVTLKGVFFKLTPEVICKLFKVENKGAKLYGDNWFNHYNLEREDVLASFQKDPTQDSPVATNLKAKCRLFHNICARTILPRAGSHDKVTDTDLLVVYHLLHKKPLNLGYLILAHMRNASVIRRSAPYAMVLTKIFKKFNISLDDEIGKDECLVINGTTVGRLHLAKIDLPPRKRTATHKISSSVKKKAKVGEPLDEVEVEDEDALPEHEQDLPEEESESSEPSSHDNEFSTPEKNADTSEEGCETSEDKSEESEEDSESKKEDAPEDEHEHEDDQEDDHALSEDNFSSAPNSPLIPSRTQSPSPILFDNPPSAMPNMELEFNSLFLNPLPLNQHYPMTGGFHHDDELHNFFQGQTSNVIPQNTPTKSSDNPLLAATRNFLTSPTTINPHINKPTTSPPLAEPSHFGSLGSFANTNSSNSDGQPKAPDVHSNIPSSSNVHSTNTDVILNLIGLQQTVASYGNRHAIMDNWMISQFLPAVAPHLPPPFLPDIVYPILPVTPVPDPSNPSAPPA